MKLIIMSSYPASVNFFPWVPGFLLNIHFLDTLSLCVLLGHFLKPLHRTIEASRGMHIEMRCELASSVPYLYVAVLFVPMVNYFL